VGDDKQSRNFFVMTTLRAAYFLKEVFGSKNLVAPFFQSIFKNQKEL
jgi:hypothetical protein